MEKVTTQTKMKPFLSSLLSSTLFMIVSCIILNSLTVHAFIMDDEILSNTTIFVTRTTNNIPPPIPNFLPRSSQSDITLMNKELLYHDTNEYDNEYGSSGTSHNIISQKPNHHYEIQDKEEEEHLSLSRNIQYRRSLQNFCVVDETGFRKAIMMASTTRIDICVPFMNIDASIPNSNTTYQGIYLQNKRQLLIRCNTTTPPCIINAQGLSRHFYTNQSNITFRDIIFQNGNSRKDIVQQKDGGVLYTDKSSIRFERCQFIYNIGSDGGVIASTSSRIEFIGGTIKSPTLFDNNTAYYDGGVIIGSKTIISATRGYFVFRNNIAGLEFGHGGAIYTEAGASTFANAVFDNNAAPYNNQYAGGALYVGGGRVTLTNVTFHQNSHDIGGALFARNATVIAINVTFSNNDAQLYGGAIFMDSCNSIFRTTTFFQNSADRGGAVIAMNSSVRFTDVTFSKNNATSGSAIDASYVDLLADNVTVEENTSTNHGIFLIGYSNVTVRNSDFDGNSVTSTGSLSGTTTIWQSKFAPTNNRFYSMEATDCDTLVYNFVSDSEEYRASCVKFSVKTSDLKRRELDIRPAVGNEIRRSLGQCKQNDSDIRDAVEQCGRNSSGVPCRIDVCKTPIRITGPASGISGNATESGIDLSNKDIIMDCVLPCPTDRCILDGGGDSRLFYGSNSNISFRNFVFANGYDTESGGAFKMENQSIVSFANCSFLNNSALIGGGAIFTNDTELLMEGNMTSLVDNTGNGAPIELFSSDFILRNAFFDGNNVSEFGGGILSFDSKIEFGILNFVTRPNIRQDNYSCDIFMATNPNNLRMNSSCISWEKTFAKPSGIDPATTCPPLPILPPMIALPTASPAARPLATTPTSLPPSPSTTPDPSNTSCFSGSNLVEVKGMGHIQMTQLRIGHYVRSGNGQFTQVYGFGHWDPAKEDMFLQIFFDDNSGNQNYVDDSSLVLEVSPRHLLMMDIDNQTYPVRASNVIVGDIFSGRTVNKIHTVLLRGVYAPLTFSGDLVVSGVRASNYVDVLDHNGWIQNQHAMGYCMFFPQRMFCNYFIETCKKENYTNGYGYTAYVIVHASMIINQLGTAESSMILSFIAMVLISTIGFFAWYFGAGIDLLVLKRKVFNMIDKL